MELYPKFRVLYDRRNVASDTREASVEIEVSINGVRRWFSTRVRVLPDQWDSQRQAVVRHPQASMLNLQINNMRSQMEAHVAYLMGRGEAFNLEHFATLVTQNRLGESFIDFIARRIEERKDIRESTRRTQRKIVGALLEFKRINAFSSITRTNIVAFDDWLHTHDYKQATVHSYHKFLKIYINDAIRAGYLDASPYTGLRIERGRPALRNYITVEDVMRLRNLECPDAALARARDLFIFQCYTGLAYSDMLLFEWERVEKKGDKYVYRYIRKKSSEPFYLILLPPALAVLERYNYRLPVISNQKYNQHLKSLGLVVGKPLSSHWGRHTYACMMLNAGMSIEIVAKTMGHADIKQTQEYARLVDKTIEKAFDRLKDSFF